MNFNFVKSKALMIVGTLSMAVFAGGCVVSVDAPPQPRYIEGIEVCGKLFDNIGPMSNFNVALHLAGRNYHKGVDFNATAHTKTDRFGWLTPCARYSLGAASDFENESSIQNPSLTAEIDDFGWIRRAGAQPYGRPVVFYDAEMGYYAMRIEAMFDFDKYTDSTEAIKKYFLKEQMRRVKEHAFGKATALKGDEDAVQKNVPGKDVDSSSKKSGPGKNVAI